MAAFDIAIDDDHVDFGLRDGSVVVFDLDADDDAAGGFKDVVEGATVDRTDRRDRLDQRRAVREQQADDDDIASMSSLPEASKVAA